MTFLHQMLSAKQGDNYAVEFLLEMYRPLLVKEAIVDGIFDVSVKWVEKWTDSTSAVHFKSGVLL